jgi:nucleotide-binding universal stress UspA family protein
MLGSISTYAIHHLPCSVLVVKEEPRPIRKVVLAIDGSAPSKKAIKFLLGSMKPWEDVPDQEPITITVVHVMPFLKYPELREAGRAMVEQCADQLARAGYLVDQAPKLGKPADEILTLAQRRKADLIVTGAKGLGAIGRLLLGSVSTRIVQHSDCSVLVVR